MIETPKPGIYPDVSFEDYLQWDALSNSRMSLAKRSLFHFKYQEWSEPTKAMTLGSLMHCGQLEPRMLSQRYVVMPEFHRDENNVTDSGKRSFAKTTKYVKLKVEQFEQRNSDKEIVEQEEYDKMLGMCNSLADNGLAHQALNGKGPTEVSYLWIDPDTGLLCKARTDKVNQMLDALVDLKTTRDALEFPKSIANFGYDRQAAHYLAGWKELTGDDYDFIIPAVETSSPFRYGLFQNGGPCVDCW